MKSDKPIRILSVEDHPVVREGLRTLITSQHDMVLVGQAEDGEDGVAQFRLHRPDITLMDLRLPGMSGTDAVTAIHAEFPHARIVMLSTEDGGAEIQRAFRAGASAYVLKSAPKSELFSVIRTVHAGHQPVPTDAATRLAAHLLDDDITPRELEVLALIRDGNGNHEIAAKLHIPEATVNFHIRSIEDKLKAKDRTHAVIIAVRRGLIPL